MPNLTFWAYCTVFVKLGPQPQTGQPKSHPNEYYRLGQCRTEEIELATPCDSVIVTLKSIS